MADSGGSASSSASDAKARVYRRVDADAHINEPPDLWRDRVPAAIRDRVPRQQRFEEGDAWVMEGLADRINFGRNIRRRGASYPDTAAGGARSAWVKWEDVSPGGYDPAVRLEEMDMDLVDAAVFYPSPRIGQLMVSVKDPEFHYALVRAYNDWLVEFCSYAPERLGAQVLLPNRGVEQALAEVARIGDRPEVVGVLHGTFPHGDSTLRPEDDVVWRAMVERGLALHTHAEVEDKIPIDNYAKGLEQAHKAGAGLRFMKAPHTIFEFLGSGVFDRVPELQVVLAEVDAGWVPYVKQELDNRFKRAATSPTDAALPSEVISEHFSYTYITDHVAVQNRHWIGVEKLMWSSDYPHTATDWPNSWRTIDADFANVPADERHLIVAGNALRLYGFDRR